MKLHIIFIACLLSSSCSLLLGFFDPSCGNGLIEGDEVCDDGNLVDGDRCDSACLPEPFCGDSELDANFEECDDGNNTSGDGCAGNCSLEPGLLCGNSVIDTGESCDGALLNGVTCLSEGFAGGTIACSSNCLFFDTSDCILITSFCGNGIVEAPEECDDANEINKDTCKNDCTFHKVIQLETGRDHSCALDEFGDVRCWGRNGDGQLGYGNVANLGDDEFPNLFGAVPLLSTSLSVGSGAFHNCALSSNTQVSCWGRGLNGRLGYGDTLNIGDDEAPAIAGAVFFGNVAITNLFVGGAHACVTDTDGNLHCWGRADKGQLGYGNTDDIGDDELPAAVPSVNLGGGFVRKASLGNFHSCVVLINGGLRCWGDNQFGQLGYGNTTNIGDTPGEDVHTEDISLGGVADISAGLDHTCVLLNDGNVFCWGRNTNGQLGYGNISNVGDNESVISFGPLNIGGDVKQISAGDNHTCAVFDDGTAKCWGANSSGQLGTGDVADFGDSAGETPDVLAPIAFSSSVESLSAGSEHTCVLLSTGQVRCWGRNSDGQLGNSSVENIENPAIVLDIVLF